MDANLILEKLANEFAGITETFSIIDETSFFYKSNKEKWSIAENIHHLTLCLIPINGRLKTPQSMLETWGSSKRVSRSYKDFVDDYDKAVNGAVWKTFPPFVATIGRVTMEDIELHASKNKEAVDTFYKLAGNQIQELPLRVALSREEGRQKVTDDFSIQYGALLKLSSGLSNTELDSYQLPLPYLGLVTIKEILYFNFNHISHHHQLIRDIYSQEKKLI